MADLPSILGGMAQGFIDFGKGAVDLFGTGGAAIGDLVESARTGKVTTKNQDDFRKWLYNTDSVKDAAAKGLGTTLNGVQTALDYIPGVNALTRNPLGNAAQGALGGLADEFKTYGENYDLGRAGQRAAVSAAGAAASGSLADALKGSSNALLSSNTLQGLARGATGGAITGGGYAAIDGGDVLEAAKQGAGMGALIGGATGLAQDFKPAKTYDVALTDSEKQARVANIDDQLARLDTSTPEGSARYNELIKARAVYDAPADKIQTLYHQTSADSFADFSPEKRSAGVMDQGTPSGIFLKETDADIGLPGKNQLMFDVKMENPYEVDSREALANYARSRSKTYADLYDQAVALDEKAANVYDDFTNELQDKYKQYYYEPDETKKAALKKDVDYLLKNIKKLSDEKAAEYKSQGADVARKAQEELSRILTQDGYDSVILANDKGSFGRNIKSYIALSPYDQMAEVNAPKALETTLADADMAVNSPRLTPEQEAYFKDSVMRDSSGNLMPVYHSSPNKFTEFDDARLGDNTAYDNTAFGHFVTNDRDFSSRFRDIDNRGIDGYTMELYADVKNPITHPYMASGKYQGADLDNIVKRYYEATDNPEALAAIKDWADESGQSLYEAYMDMTVDENPFDAAATERDLLRNKGYDAVEFVEGLKNELVDGSTDKTPISSYAIFRGNQLKDVNNVSPTSDVNIMESRMLPDDLDLGRTLAGQDMTVNSAKIAPGQLGLFDGMPTQTPKTSARQTSLFDQPDNPYLDYYSSDIDTMPLTPEAPANPYAPVDGQVTQAMRDRAADILGNWKKNGVPENELYNAINPDTLPLGYKEAIDVLDNIDAKKYLKDNLGVTDIKKAKFDKVLDYLFGDNEDAKRARIEMRDQQIESAKQKAKLLGLPGPSKNFVPTVEAQLREEVEYKMAKDISKSLKNIPVDAQTGEVMPLTSMNLERLDPKKHSFRTGYTAAADEAFSERLGIAPGNTPKYNGKMDVRGAYGRYQHPFYGAGGDVAVFERKMDSPEDAISSIAHERLHSFQNEANNEFNRAGRYSKEVQDAYNDLHKDLESFKKTPQETAKRYGRSQYWQLDKEQEARMLETYLQNKGYADAPNMKNKYRAGEWGNEINPAFDKFFDKLRDLSKRGVALPALAALFGGGAYMASQENDKDKEVK